MRVNIISIWSDENQHESQINSIRRQSHVLIDHVIRSGLSALEAERTIYQESKACSDSHDLIIRMDGDMVFRDMDTIQKIVDWFSSEEGRNHDRLTIPVRDFFTDSEIIGMHAWRASAVPAHARIDPPKPESWINEIRGVIDRSGRFGVVYHAFDPSPMQAFRFGWHRGAKAMSGGVFHQHWITLRKVESHYRRSAQNPSLGYVMIGAAAAWGDLKGVDLNWQDNDYRSPHWKEAIETVTQRMEAIHREIGLDRRYYVARRHKKRFRAVLPTALMLFFDEVAFRKIGKFWKK